MRYILFPITCHFVNIEEVVFKLKKKNITVKNRLPLIPGNTLSPSIENTAFILLAPY